MYKKVLDRYLRWITENYDTENPKIQEKIEHTNAVLKVATYIATKEKLSAEDILIAQVTAIVHDCARFMQIELYDSFRDSPEFNHATKGAKMLRNGLLEQFFPETREFDDIIITAVELHSSLDLPDDLWPRVLKHCNLLRDADKLDLYNMCIRRFDILFWGELGEPNLSPIVKTLFEQRKPISFSALKGQLDLLALRIGFICHLKNKSALSYVKKKNFVNRLIDKFAKKRPFYNQEDVEWIRTTALTFFE